MPDFVLALASQQALIGAQYGAADAAMICDAVEDAVRAVRDELWEDQATLLREVQELDRTIATAKVDIAELRADDINNSHIPSATDEPDAIAAHTASATDTILQGCETLDGVAKAMGAQAADFAVRVQLQAATTRIYEACGFQDITGQRITKVVATLKTIEAKVSAMLGAFDTAQAAAVTVHVPATLLNGPQRPTHAMGQVAIDALLASFE